MQRELCEIRVESEQLKLDGLRQRKQNSILRLKLAGAKEDVDLLQRNLSLLGQYQHRLEQELTGIRTKLATATRQLTHVSAEKTVVQAECAKYQVRIYIGPAGTGGADVPACSPYQWLGNLERVPVVVACKLPSCHVWCVTFGLWNTHVS